MIRLPLKVQVTQEMIDAGVRGGLGRCPGFSASPLDGLRVGFSASPLDDRFRFPSTGAKPDYD